MTWPDAFVTAVDHVCWTFIAWRSGATVIRWIVLRRRGDELNARR